mmetsp:Transcript_141633/g.440305  ORF Transcript_141633/g.440305 Transcript_141633/m.440305 type:complete len:357 (+) Transcript_141633:1072-2142(+)
MAADRGQRLAERAEVRQVVRARALRSLPHVRRRRGARCAALPVSALPAAVHTAVTSSSGLARHAVHGPDDAGGCAAPPWAVDRASPVWTGRGRPEREGPRCQGAGARSRAFRHLPCPHDRRQRLPAAAGSLLQLHAGHRRPADLPRRSPGGPRGVASGPGVPAHLAAGGHQGGPHARRRRPRGPPGARRQRRGGRGPAAPLGRRRKRRSRPAWLLRSLRAPRRAGRCLHGHLRLAGRHGRPEGPRLAGQRAGRRHLLPRVLACARGDAELPLRAVRGRDEGAAYLRLRLRTPRVSGPEWPRDGVHIKEAQEVQGAGLGGGPRAQAARRCRARVCRERRAMEALHRGGHADHFCVGV